jgi:hypothetical protein
MTERDARGTYLAGRDLVHGFWTPSQYYLCIGRWRLLSAFLFPNRKKDHTPANMCLQSQQSEGQKIFKWSE